MPYAQVFESPMTPLRSVSIEVPDCDEESVVIEVAGCGVCHTDLAFLEGSVRTRKPPPLVLGHEISGRVVTAGRSYEALLGRGVIVPSVIPCGQCFLCQSGRENICQSQVMPGNDADGGWASHCRVPGRFLCVVPEDLGSFRLSELAVIADAVTTPYQAVVKARVGAGDVVIVVGVGGLGIYLVQHARNRGAHVVAIDINEERLRRALEQGACDAFMADGEGLRNRIRERIGERSDAAGWKIFETSGTSSGQLGAFALLQPASVLSVVGYTREKILLRLSNVMALDAEVIGTWGCRPAYYDIVLGEVLSGKIDVRSNLECYPLSDANDIVRMAREGKLERRAILIP